MQKSRTLQADSNALRRALLILIDNALKYTPEGGVVNVTLETNQDFAVASVSDTGIGIAPPDVPHIFDRFRRADKARSREQGGAGLGLSIAKWVVEIYRGSIAVESRPQRAQGSMCAFLSTTDEPLERIFRLAEYNVSRGPRTDAPSNVS